MKQILLLPLLFFVLLHAKAQEIGTIQDEIDHFYSQIKTDEITTGILINKTLSFADIAKFDGIKDTACSYENWEQIYLELYNASLIKSDFKSLQEIRLFCVVLA